MSTTSLPENAPSEPPPRPMLRPPLLASDILLEDVAPLRPGQHLLKIALAIMAVIFAAAAASAYFGVSSARAGIAGLVLTAAAALGLSAIAAPYAARAALAVVVGLVPLVLGAFNDGPLAPNAGEPLWRGFATLVLVAVVPGVLLFRARYRALTAARVLLGVAFALGAPAIAMAMIDAFAAAAPLPVRLADGVLAGAACAGAFGFMGAETTGGGGVWAAGIVLAASARIGCTAWLLSPGANAASATAAALGFAAASMPVALGCMQLLAVWLAASARRDVDVHKAVGPSEERPEELDEQPKEPQ